MPYTIVIGSEKGGVGKSTLTLCLAGELARRGKGVVILDADAPQHSTARFASRAVDEVPKVVAISGDIGGFNTDADNVLIDCPGRESSILRSALLRADLLLIPVAADDFDIWQVQSLWDQAEQVRRDLGRPLEARVLVNRFIAREEDANRALDSYLAEAKYQRLRTRISDTNGYRKARRQKRLPSPRTERRAVEDIRALADEVIRMQKKGRR